MSSILVLIRRKLVALTLVLSCTVVPPLVHADTSPANKVSATELLAKNNPFKNKLYDASYKKWTLIYTPEIPWYWHKAQGIAESGLNPNAVSPVGAAGIGQFMPDTWSDMEARLNFKGSVYTPSLNIQAQIFYMSTLMGQFKKDRPLYDRYSLALASYNAGLGNILKAQMLGGGGLMYQPMIKALPKVTGKQHSTETRTYVSRIWEYIGVLTKLEETSND